MFKQFKGKAADLHIWDATTLKIFALENDFSYFNLMGLPEKNM